MVEISTDKVDGEVFAPAAGVLTKILAETDETVTVGQVAGRDRGRGGAGGSRARADARRGTASRGDGAGEIVDVAIPEMGDSVAEGTILEWLVKPGDTVAKDDPLVEISTDKVDAELPSPVAGTVTELLVEPDETVAVGTVVCRIEAGDGRARRHREPRPPTRRRPSRPPRPPAPAGNGDGNATPVAARMAADHGLDLDEAERQRPARARDQGRRGGGPGGQRRSPPRPRRPPGRPSPSAAPPPRSCGSWTRAARSPPPPASARSRSTRLAARRAQLKAAGQEALVHPPDRLGDRAGRRRHAGDGALLRRGRRQAPPRHPGRREPRAWRWTCERKDGTRSLVVPVIKDASDDGLRRLRGRLRRGWWSARATTSSQPDAYAGAQITLTNPGGIGTVASVPRLMPGQGTIVATGAIGYPPGLAQAEPGKLARAGRGQGHDDDLHLRPPRDPGRRVGRVPQAHRRAAAGRGRLLRRRCSARWAWRPARVDGRRTAARP